MFNIKKRGLLSLLLSGLVFSSVEAIPRKDILPDGWEFNGVKQYVECGNHNYRAYGVKKNEDFTWFVESVSGEIIGDEKSERELYSKIALNASLNTLLERADDCEEDLNNLAYEIGETAKFHYLYPLGKLILREKNDDEETGENVIRGLVRRITEAGETLLNEPERLKDDKLIAEVILKAFDMEGAFYAQTSKDYFRQAARLCRNGIRDCEEADRFYKLFKSGYVNKVKAEAIKKFLDGENIDEKLVKKFVEEDVEIFLRDDLDLEERVLKDVDEVIRHFRNFEREFIVKKDYTAARFLKELGRS